MQCYNYLNKHELPVENLNNNTLYDVDTEDWWKQNTPVSPQYQYSGIKHPQTMPQYPFPYINYSQYVPYWNINSYDGAYWLSQTTSQNNLTFEVLNQNITTCFNGCNNLIIGLLQWPYAVNNINEYTNDANCLPPGDQ